MVNIVGDVTLSQTLSNHSCVSMFLTGGATIPFVPVVYSPVRTEQRNINRLPLMSGDAYLAEMDASTAKYTPSPYTLPANILNLLVKIYTYIASSKETTV